MAGLGDRWRGVYPAYHKIVGVYERMNAAMTFGNADRWRRQAASLLDSNVEKILDAGCGPGNMERHLRGHIVGLDYSLEMLRANPYEDKVQGVFELMPFRDDAFDAAVLGYSLHAARDLEAALAELVRVAREVVAVSMGKPDNRAAEALARFYVAYIVPLMARLLAPALVQEYKALKTIFDSALRNNELRKLLERWLELKYFGTRGLGTIYIFAGIRRATPRRRTA
nr:MAG: methyltransferase type 11 [Thermoproteus sp. AZ2]